MSGVDRKTEAHEIQPARIGTRPEERFEEDFEDDDDGFFVVFLLEAANVVASMSFPKRRRKTHDAFSNELVVVVFR